MGKTNCLGPYSYTGHITWRRYNSGIDSFKGGKNVAESVSGRHRPVKHCGVGGGSAYWRNAIFRVDDEPVL